MKRESSPKDFDSKRFETTKQTFNTSRVTSSKKLADCDNQFGNKSDCHEFN
jgi:hypothetical protein